LLALGIARADTKPDQRDVLAQQLAAETATLDTTRATIDGKIKDADAVRVARLRAAYRLVRAPLRADATLDDRLAAARRRAAARLLLTRDTAERALLVDENKQLAVANERTIIATRQLPTLALPDKLAWPAKGTIARHYGTLEHERSKATLARHGIDIEVDPHAKALAPAAGTVRYAGPIRGLDQGIVIDCGDYYTVVGKLGDLAVPVGTAVALGDTLGRSARHRVYLEVRVKLGAGGLPIDPEPLLDSSSATR
jgi:septal ring factor EnvC (AmiA/AmiB activator)